jgi:hypothetical protein
MNAPMVIPQGGALVSAEEIRDHVNVIQKVMQAVMKKDTHYGVVPGSKKPSLYKPGAETLCKTFHIAPSFQVEDISTADYYRYRVKCVGVHQGSGVTLGEGVGACSSNEEKYKWRRAICDEEYDEAPEGRRRIKFGKYQGKVEKTRQIRAEPDDIDNTVLKMACKRALVAMTLNVLAASDIFAQDIEDLPDHLRDVAVDELAGLPEADRLAFETEIDAAESTEALAALWKRIVAACNAAKDKSTYDALKAKVTARGTALTKPVEEEPV